MDVRGAMPAGGGGPAVLEDPSGRRARWMRRAGRAVFVLFLAWLVVILLGGLGLSPVGGIPFSHTLRPSQGPPLLARPPRPRQPSASDLRPAVPAAVLARQRRLGRPAAKPVAARGHSALAPGHGGTPRGRSTTAPGHTASPPAPPGQTRTSTAPVPPRRR